MSSLNMHVKHSLKLLCSLANMFKDLQEIFSIFLYSFSVLYGIWYDTTFFYFYFSPSEQFSSFTFQRQFSLLQFSNDLI